MSYSNARPSAGNAGPGSRGTTFRVAFGLYVGSVLAGATATAAAQSLESSPRLLAIAAATFAAGTVVGAGLAGRLRGLPSRLGRTWVRKLAVICGALPFAAVVVASVVGPLESPVGLAALGSVVAVHISGLVLAQVAENGYVDAVTRGVEPTASWRWHWSASGSRVLDLFLFGTWSLLALSYATMGEWWSVIVWTGFAVGVAVVSVAEGRWARWLPGASAESARIRVYEHGFATGRPYRRQFIPWSSISYARVRNGKLVVDCGFFDLEFDRDALEDPEAVLEAIDRQLHATDGR